MKSVFASLIVIIVFIVFAAAAYYIVPAMVDKSTSGLKSEVQNLTQRVQKIEEEAKVAALPQDADAGKIVKTINSLVMKSSSLEETIRKQKAESDDLVKRQTESIEKFSKDIQAKLQTVTFAMTLASVRNHVLRVQMELRARNIGTAKTELDQVGEMFEKMKPTSNEENKKLIEELQASLRRARSEIDTDLPAATDRIELLWREIGKLGRKL
jgi:DNA repair exonuclease SbcCD ATPase subunit